MGGTYLIIDFALILGRIYHLGSTEPMIFFDLPYYIFLLPLSLAIYCLLCWVIAWSYRISVHLLAFFPCVLRTNAWLWYYLVLARFKGR